MRQTIVITALLLVGAWLGVLGWRTCGPYGAACAAAGQYFPMHDTETDALSGVVYDLSGNGTLETFVTMRHSRTTEITIDTNEDGEIDRRLQPDGQGVLRAVPVESVGTVGDRIDR
jgi:hypothetical protein